MVISAQLLFLAAVLATSAGADQQPTTAPPKPSSNTPDDRLPTPAVPARAIVDGCVATESEIPGRKVSLGERVRLDKHFILFQSKVVKGKAPLAASPTGEAAGFGRLYKISGLTDEQLKVHLGRRVRIEGSFGNLEQASVPAGAADQSELVELNVATIRQVPGECTTPKS
jgi:hypothetical protein